MISQVQIIILNWNGYDLTLDCLKSLSKISYTDFKILVVDNGSADDSVRIIQEQYPDVELLALDNNLGFAGGNNAGFDLIKNRDPMFVIFLNNDTIVDANFIEPLISSLIENTDIGQTVPKIFYANDKERIWYAGGKVNLWLGKVAHIGIRQLNGNMFNTAKFTDYATGCCFAMRTQDFAKFGGFDTSFPMYGEDVDLSLKIRKDGQMILFVPSSKIWHRVSASMGGEFSISKYKKKIRGLFRIFSKHSTIPQKLTTLIYGILSIPFQLLRLTYLFFKSK